VQASGPWFQSTGADAAPKGPWQPTEHVVDEPSRTTRAFAVVVPPGNVKQTESSRIPPHA
jgi:hypothetical protein